MNKTSYILNNKWFALLFLASAFALIYNPLTKFPFTFCVVALFIFITTYLQNGNLSGLNFKKLGVQELKTILLVYVGLELLMDFIFQPGVSWLFNEPADYSTFESIKDNVGMYFKYLLYMWISAAFGEELLFRGYAFLQFQKIFGNKKPWIVLLSAVLFSLPHLYQGLSGLVMTFLFGIVFGLIYSKYQNIWINIIVHGLIDTVFLTLSYLGYLEFYNLFGK